MILMSIDGSTKSSGIAIFNVETKELIHYECVSAASTEKINRINKMTKAVCDLYEKYKVDYIIMEEPLPEDVKNNNSTFKALMYLQAAIAISLFNSYGKKIDEFIYVSSWRSACGITVGRYGHRESVKAEDINFVKDKYGIDVNDDIADAICIGWAWLNHRSSLAATKDSHTKSRPIGQEKSAF